MRSFVLSVALMAFLVAAKPLEEKVEVEEMLPVVPHSVGFVDAVPTVTDEVATIVEGSVENLIPFGAVEEKSESVKKDAPEQQDTMPVVDWLSLVLNEDLGKPVEEPTTTTAVSEKIVKLEWLKAALNYESFLRYGLPTTTTTEASTTTVAVPKETDRLHWPIARQLAAHLLGRTMIDVMEKEDQHSILKNKFRWSKLNAEPVENFERYVPTNNAVQWSSAEAENVNAPAIGIPNEVPSNSIKNKEQWFVDEEM
ncbi:hypothetical protein M3Y96_00367300 [Aphelenchoides besseyi]|nr:hypothetical protein M3Y96_00367300 [Aphelenchoides besseyi]